MDVAKLVLQYVQALAWPILVAGVLIGLRRHLVRMVGNLAERVRDTESVEGPGGLKVSFAAAENALRLTASGRAPFAELDGFLKRLDEADDDALMGPEFGDLRAMPDRKEAVSAAWDRMKTFVDEIARVYGVVPGEMVDTVERVYQKARGQVGWVGVITALRSVRSVVAPAGLPLEDVDFDRFIDVLLESCNRMGDLMGDSVGAARRLDGIPLDEAER